jgi:hypothetical protein
MTTNSHCPTSEDLAAYIDGMLGPEEGARITEHLAGCERCYELYTEVLRFQLDSAEAEAAGSGGKVVAFPQMSSKRTGVPVPSREKASMPSRWRGVPWWIAVAAAAMVLVGFGLYRLFLAPVPSIAVADLTGPLEKYPDAADNLWGYAIQRGGGKDESEEEFRAAFQVGALLVDFRLAAQAGRIEKSSELVKKIGITVKPVLFSENGERLIAEANQIDSAESLNSIARKFAADESYLADPSLAPLPLDFGKWTEAGRLAAILEEPTFYRWGNRRFLKSLLKDKELGLEDEVLIRLRQIEAVWDKGDLQPADYAALAESFQRILDSYDFRG